MTVAGEVITTILEAITTFLAGIGSSIVSFFNSIVLDDEGALSIIAIWILIFLGLSLAIGLARLVFAIFRTRR